MKTTWSRAASTHSKMFGITRAYSHCGRFCIVKMDSSARSRYCFLLEVDGEVVKSPRGFDRTWNTATQVKAYVARHYDEDEPVPQVVKATIRITSNVDQLATIWNREWAEKHSGKTYEAMIQPEDKWAEIEGSRFPPCVYEIVE